MAASVLDLSSASSLASTFPVSDQVSSTKHFTASSQCNLLPWREKRRFFNFRTSQQGEQFLRRAVVCRAKYSVKLIMPKGEESLIMADDVYILDAAEDHGVALPYSCRSGACSSCAAVLKEGKVDQSNQTYLEDSQVEAGYVLTCVAYPLSDIVLETHRESGLY